MLNQEQRNTINKRLTAISNLSDRTDGKVEMLLEEFTEICGMEDSPERTEKEKEFQDNLIDAENYISYLKERKRV